MPKYSSIHKRVKRHVIGRWHAFFAACPPALAGLTKIELKRLLKTENEVQSRPGGFEFKGRLDDACRVNLLSRFSNRVLMHLTAFRATSFSQLEHKLSEFPWELYLYRESAVKIRVAARKCRLYHSSAVAERVQGQVRSRLEKFALPAQEGQSPDQVQQLFVKGNDDRFTVSIDSSGDHLYKRGLKTHGGTAPLRENLAAAVLQWAGYDGREPLVDPMCGSGTFSLEAALWTANIPPGWYRKFAFMDWPSFVERRWRHLREQVESGFRSPPPEPMILASDMDGDAIGALKRTVQDFLLENRVKVRRQDFFEFKPSDWALQPGLVALNPPYGRRLDQPAGGIEPGRIFEQLARHYSGWRLALILPRRQFNREMPFEFRIHPLTHGGLAVAAAVGRIR